MMDLRRGPYIGNMERPEGLSPYPRSKDPLPTTGASWYVRPNMLRLVRIALQIVLFFALLSVAVALGAAEVGVLEKIAVAAFGVLLVWLAGRVRRIARA